MGTAPKWLKATPEEVCDQIYKFAKKGMTPSQIGIVLRDSYGVAQVKSVTGNKIVRILKSVNLALNRKDMDSKFRMVLIEARIHRLVRYYIRAGQLPPSFKYEADKASAIVS